MAEGIGELMTDVRNTYMEKFDQEKLFAWHKMLLRGDRAIKVGA